MTQHRISWLMLSLVSAVAEIGCAPELTVTGDPDGGSPGSGASSGSTSGGTNDGGVDDGGSGSGGASGMCSAGTSECAGNTVQTCDGNGTWQPADPCPEETASCTSATCKKPPSCEIGGDSAGTSCGTAGKPSCCTSGVITGGTFNRDNNPIYPAKLSDFRLDRFEVTVGRFRTFVDAYPGSIPATDAGEHPLIDGSGWSQFWADVLPKTKAELVALLKCGTAPTWTDAPGANEDKPISCINWYEAFAFCARDGGRLPTEAEWNYTACGGGNEQRAYPWGGDPPSPMHAVYSVTLPASVGSKSPTGDGKWGHSDLAGNVWEWALDWYAPYSTEQCNDCANLSIKDYRIFRGGGFTDTQSTLLTYERHYDSPTERYDTVGARCARSP
jgi:sulfatase modifying factor 1